MRHDAPQPAQRPAQPRPNLADQLERITPRFDELTQRARLGADRIPAAELHELEEMAQHIARDLVALFRGAGARPVNPPAWVSADGTRAGW
ncbi:hypothetical protein [Sphingomonas sp. Leaf37]|uniref:hypothetical protein n=1 Tax=Sphingomonas sp. Leaf37 TaxID=2876552 RepID=UPI001E486CA6|nr:hypothetical protein [Sphingomonas sp. Leaf37]